jgi:hypothetical protein
VTTDYHNWFIDTVQSFEALVREIYRRVAYNISGSLPKVGMLRTRLVGIKGYETKSPEEAARAILEYFFT